MPDPAIQILTVDDPALALALQETFCRRASCRLLATTSIEETLTKARLARPDLIVLDAAGWGADCSRLLRLDATLAETPLILIDRSAGGPLEDADAVVERPLSAEAVVRTIRRFITLPERRSGRRPFSGRVSYRRNGQTESASAKDVGPLGMFARTRERFEVGDSLELAFELPSVPPTAIRATGEVVRRIASRRDSHLVPGVGIRFTRVAEDARAELARFAGEPGSRGHG